MAVHTPDAVEIGQRTLDILADGSFSSTYKYAVLMAMVDLCQQSGEDGNLPTTLTTRQLAVAVTQIYWRQVQPQAVPSALIDEVPRQNKDTRHELQILRAIRELQERFEDLHGKPAAQPRAVEKHLPHAFAELIRSVEDVLVRMPLPRLQHIGRTEDRFLYDIHWTLADVQRGKRRPPGFSDYLRRDREQDTALLVAPDPSLTGFDNRLFLREGVADAFVRLGPLLRSAIQLEWTRTVATINDFEEARLEEFLFGSPARVQLPRSLQDFLLKLQDHRCFYTGQPLTPRTKWHVDHFIPWSLNANDGLANLVITRPTINLQKSNHLAAADHLARWVRRNTQHGTRLADAAGAAGWTTLLDESLASARANYLRAHPHRHLWLRSNEFERIDPPRIRRALGL